MNVYIFSVPLSTIILYGMNIANFLTHKYFNIHSIFLVKTKRVSRMELFLYCFIIKSFQNNNFNMQLCISTAVPLKNQVSS